MTAHLDTSEKKIAQNIDETEQSLLKKISLTEETLGQKIKTTQEDLGREIDHAQTIATGAPLVILDNPKKVARMQESLKAYAACVKSGGGASCLKGKCLINSCQFQLLIVT